MPNTILKVEIKEEHIAKAIQAFEYQSDKNIMMHSDKGSIDFKFASQTGEETTKEWGDRIAKECFFAVFNLAFDGIEKERYNADVAGISPANPNVPKDILI